MDRGMADVSFDVSFNFGGKTQCSCPVLLPYYHLPGSNPLEEPRHLPTQADPLVQR